MDLHDDKDKPIHTSVFKYRSRSLLQAMEIIDGERVTYRWKSSSFAAAQ